VWKLEDLNKGYEEQRYTWETLFLNSRS
jgi:hypothetical protein